MEHPSSLPTAEEIASLTEAFRRDPSSDAFVHLGERFLALGRARDAVEVGARGLKANPGHIPGRLMVARAFATLHQWKEAQAELLKVVKADRNNAQGFALLGEVLMRRNDYERALPVLQHAQNLLPADVQVLSLLRRARAGQPLDPPPPVPAAMAPAGGGMDQAALARVDVVQRQVEHRGPEAPRERAADRVRQDERAQDRHAFGPVEHHAPPAAEDPFAPLGAGSSAPLGAGPQVRPRVLPMEKPKDAAQASLRQSAAVGEQYLNSLLTGGLLDVPNVRASAATYDVAPGKKWGRSTQRLFIYLFVILFAGLGGGGFWYWYSDNQRRADVERHLATAVALVDSGDYADLSEANTEVRAALTRDKSSLYTMAVLAEVTSLSSLLYGEFDPAEVEKAIATVARDVETPSDEGYRELVIARAASTLATLDDAEDAETRLTKVRSDLASWLSASPDDHLASWLLGRAELAAGARTEARASFEKAHAGGEGPAIATVALADMALDDGDFEQAMKLYDDALERSPTHPLAFVGRSLARSERRAEVGDAMADLNVGLAAVEGPRLVAWKQLALGFAKYVLHDYDEIDGALDKATGVTEPRFLARLGLARMLQGRIVDAATARAAITWYASDPEPHPLVDFLDAELLLARGLPREALSAIGDRDGLRAASLRGRARFELGEYEAAQKELEAALAIAPEDEGLLVWTEASRMIAGRGDVRDRADQALDSLGRKAQSKAPRYVHGVALAAIGKRSLARDKLELSVEDITDEYPNPLAYRSHVALAELDLADGKAAAAKKHLERALEINPGFLPARDLMGQVLASSEPDRARDYLADVINAKVASAGAELALVEVLMPSTEAEARDAAIAAIGRAQDKGAKLEALQAAVLLVDEALFEELGIAAPKD